MRTLSLCVLFFSLSLFVSIVSCTSVETEVVEAELVDHLGAAIYDLPASAFHLTKFERHVAEEMAMNDANIRSMLEHSQEIEQKHMTLGEIQQQEQQEINEAANTNLDLDVDADADLESEADAEMDSEIDSEMENENENESDLDSELEGENENESEADNEIFNLNGAESDSEFIELEQLLELDEEQAPTNTADTPDTTTTTTTTTTSTDSSDAPATGSKLVAPKIVKGTTSPPFIPSKKQKKTLKPCPPKKKKNIKKILH